MANQLYVEQESCSICGLCVDEYPEAFRMTEEGPAEVYKQGVLKEDQIDDVVEICPAGCIHYE